MTVKDIKSRCGEISRSAGKCAFSQDNVLGFIDTSPRLDGTRGIAFFGDGLVVNIGGYARGIPYADIRSVTVIESFEDSFADELIISGIDCEIRISDYSVDKGKLKRLIDDIRATGVIEENNAEIPENSIQIQQENAAEINDNLAPNNGQILNENAAENSTEFQQEINVEIPENSNQFQQENAAEINDNLAPNNGQFSDENAAENSTEFQQEINVEIPDNSAIFEQKNADNLWQFPSGVFEENAAEIVEENNAEIPENSTQIQQENVAEINDNLTPNSGQFSDENVAENMPDSNAEILHNTAVFEQENISEIPVISEQNYNEFSSEFPQENIPKTNFENERNFSEKSERNYNEFPQDNSPQNNIENSRENERSFAEKAEDFLIGDNARFTSVKVVPPTANNFTFETVYDDFDEQAELEKISTMSHEQTLDYLADAFAEINGDSGKNYADNFTDEVFDEPNPQIQSAYDVRNYTGEGFVEPRTQIQPPADEKTKSVLNYPAGEMLTAEPMWGDIYIKASRSLRELCEQGKLSMEKIREELRERLLSSAEAFVQITADEAKIPKVLMPRITELKSAVKNYGEYFSYGEDIGTRALFFMLFQMLSYADRIVEDPVAKDRLNDFFRRFGSAGIILSMLDMRV